MRKGSGGERELDGVVINRLALASHWPLASPDAPRNIVQVLKSRTEGRGRIRVEMLRRLAG